MRGFTLIEILVVLFIISIVTSVALLRINRNEQKDMEVFTNDIAQMISLAKMEAMLQPNIMQWRLTDHQLVFATQAMDAAHQLRWKPVEKRALAPRAIPDQYALRLEMKNVKTHPSVVISNNGDFTPFKLYVGKVGQKPRWMIQGDADGHLATVSLS